MFCILSGVWILDLTYLDFWDTGGKILMFSYIWKRKEKFTSQNVLSCLKHILQSTKEDKWVLEYSHLTGNSTKSNAKQWVLLSILKRKARNKVQLWENSAAYEKLSTYCILYKKHHFSLAIMLSLAKSPLWWECWGF